jgi:hypothetical protein
MKSVALALLATFTAGAAPAEEIPPERWLDCYAATRLRQESIRSSADFRMETWLAAGEPRLVYYRLLPFYLVWSKKARPDKVDQALEQAADEMRRAKSAVEVEQLAETCTANLPPVGKAAFYDKYPWLKAETVAPKTKKNTVRAPVRRH